MVVKRVLCSPSSSGLTEASSSTAIDIDSYIYHRLAVIVTDGLEKMQKTLIGDEMPVDSSLS